VVLSDGKHHNAAVTTLDFLGNRGCMGNLRLHPHAEADEKTPTETLRPAAPEEYQPGCFALEEERGANWKGSGRTVPSIKEAKPSL